MGKVKQTRRKLAQFFNWRVSVTLTDGRVLVGTLMAVDRHVNLVLCNTEEYRRYKVRGKPEGKELKRMLGFIVCRGTGILYVQPEELGKEELVETDRPKKAKANAKAAPAAAPALPKVPAGMGQLPPGLAGLPPGLLAGMRPPGGLGMLAGLPGMPNFGGFGRGMQMPGMPGLPALPGLPGMPQLNPAMMAQLQKAGLPRPV
mmetsp:Transcript_1875/g.4281  ORF Transcript_1875/g.4281 Transcript_1875/m.4281 type:complete len:202 (-) Transcript_1875:71-676(-)|eukprot:CAMPEP_0170599580 /NCGR_PEP_ID=MMETSP0224-20130122/16879_1 /TAXON_ID=285029 /ORGANISM="Togula jolla, Strain CCCM 725" /LENGTH=201 /DNA_ID=CAMNT_0010924253 /DNA_START=93 /DNA_END=698 /DNA_ORIENTATION=+